MDHQRRQLLLVDGDRSRAEKLARRLAGLEYDFRIAENGAEGLLLAHERRPDVVLLAAHLPVLNGYLFLEALRCEAATAGIPAILITEGAGAEELARGWKSGADLCIPRTLGEADVLATLHRALSNIATQDGASPEVPLNS